MNILREVRRVKQKSMPIRIISILIFSVILIINTFAWFSAQRDLKLGGLTGDVTSWDVSYYVNEDENEILNQTATFTIDELYPGMPVREDVVHIYNRGTSSTNINYELISVKVFGEEVLPQLQSTGEIVTDSATNTTNLFSKETAYPFNISYTYNRDYLSGRFENDAITPNAHAIFRFNVSWDYGEEGSTSGEISAKDVLDTKFGKDAYEYYQNVLNDPSKAIQVQVKITSNFIHPDLES